MKLQKMKIAGILMAVILSLFCLVSCTQEKPISASSGIVSAETEVDGVWQNALYTEDTVLGEGSKSVDVEVIVADKQITFTLKTDATTLADALLESKVVEGSIDSYGLYIKKVNGILADYDVDKSYWSLSKDGQASMVGASSISIKDGEKYELTYTK